MIREHRALDDAADEKIARDAAEGKMRIKRRNNGVDLDSDEDEDEEDPDARRRRQKMNKKRRIDGDSLDALGTCFFCSFRLTQLSHLVPVWLRLISIF